MKSAWNSTATSKSPAATRSRSEEHTSELQSQSNFVCRLLLENNRASSRRSNTQSGDTRSRKGPRSHERPPLGGGSERRRHGGSAAGSRSAGHASRQPGARGRV